MDKKLMFIGTQDFNFDKDVIYDDENDCWYTPRDLSGNVFVARNIIANNLKLKPTYLDFDRVFLRLHIANENEVSKYVDPIITDLEIFNIKVLNSRPYWRIFLPKNVDKIMDELEAEADLDLDTPETLETIIMPTPIIIKPVKNPTSPMPLLPDIPEPEPSIIPEFLPIINKED